MTPEEFTDAVWSARLLAEGKCIKLSDEATLTICRALVLSNDMAELKRLEARRLNPRMVTP